MKDTPALKISTVAVMTAVTAALTLWVRIPLPSRGYITLADVIIYFCALVFGPFTALIAGGLGTAVADLVGYPQFAPISFVVHGLQGLVAGLLLRGAAGAGGGRRVLAFAAGTAVMVGGYFLAEIFLLGTGPALLELPFNLVQNVVGVAVSLPLALAVRRAWPPVGKLGW